MAQSDCGCTKEKWQNSGMCRLSETECSHGEKFTDGILDAVVGHEIYSFLDGFSGYNQVRIHLDDQEKTAFVTEWGVFVVVVMMFGLKTALATFQRVIQEIFHEYIPTFMQVFWMILLSTVGKSTISTISDYV